MTIHTATTRDLIVEAILATVRRAFCFIFYAPQYCVACGHLRTGHSRFGCGETVDGRPDGPPCPCTIPFMDKGSFR